MTNLPDGVDEQAIVKYYKEQTGLTDPNVKSWADIESHVNNNIVPRLHQFNSDSAPNPVTSQFQNRNTPVQDKWFDNSLNQLNGEGLEFLLRITRMKNVTDSKYIINTCKTYKLPLPVLLTFAQEESLINPDTTKSDFQKVLGNLASLLSKLWKLGLHSPEELATGMLGNKKVYGYYWSDLKYSKNGIGKVPVKDLRDYDDARSIGYSSNPKFASNLATSYTSLKTQLQPYLNG